MPFVRINLVDETFKPSPKTVEMRRTVGNDEKSMALGEYSTIRRIKMDSRRFNDINRSNTGPGNGMMSIITTTIAIIATKRSAIFL
jgi:hypothetical protein